MSYIFRFARFFETQSVVISIRRARRRIRIFAMRCAGVVGCAELFIEGAAAAITNDMADWSPLRGKAYSCILNCA